MKVQCYAVFDAKVAQFHLAIFDLKHEGAIRQFSDNVNDPKTVWNRHPEDYSLWFVGSFDTEKGLLQDYVPENLVNASAVMALKTPQMELFNSDGVKNEEKVN